MVGFKLEMQLRRVFGRYRWFRRSTQKYFGWYWRKAPRDYMFEENELAVSSPASEKLVKK